MNRGDLVTVAAGSGYGAKPRPAVIVQSDSYRRTVSVTLCLLTSRPVPESPTLRVALEPTPTNNLRVRSWIMVDKLLTVPRAKLGHRSGELVASKLEVLERSLMLFLGLVGAGEQVP